MAAGRPLSSQWFRIFPTSTARQENFPLPNRQIEIWARFTKRRCPFREPNYLTQAQCRVSLRRESLGWDTYAFESVWRSGEGWYFTGNPPPYSLRLVPAAVSAQTAYYLHFSANRRNGAVMVFLLPFLREFQMATIFGATGNAKQRWRCAEFVEFYYLEPRNVPEVFQGEI